MSKLLRCVGSAIDSCIVASAEAAKACVREILRHCTQLAGAASAFTLDLIHRPGYYARQASRFPEQPPRSHSPQPPSSCAFRPAGSRSAAGKRPAFCVWLWQRTFGLLISIAHVLLSLLLPRALFRSIVDGFGLWFCCGYSAARANHETRLRRAPSELNFQSPAPASTGFLEDACVVLISRIHRAASFLRLQVQRLFGLDPSKNAHGAAAAAAAASLTDSTQHPLQPQQQQQQQQKQKHYVDPHDCSLNSDVSARFGLSVSRLVSKAG